VTSLYEEDIRQVRVRRLREAEERARVRAAPRPAGAAAAVDAGLRQFFGGAPPSPFALDVQAEAASRFQVEPLTPAAPLETPAVPSQEDRLFGASQLDALGRIRKGQYPEGPLYENRAYRGLMFVPLKFGQGLLAGLEWSGQQAEQAAKHVTAAAQRVVPGTQALEQRVQELRKTGLSYGQAVNQAWEETHLELITVPFTKTAFTPKGSITVDAEDVIAAGFDPLLIAASAAGGTGAALKATGIGAKAAAGATGAAKTYATYTGLRGAGVLTRGTVRAGRELAGGNIPSVITGNIIPNQLAILPLQPPPRVVARIAPLDKLEAQLRRSDFMQRAATYLADARAGPVAKRIIGLANPSAIDWQKADDLGRRAGTVYEVATAHGAQGVKLAQDVVLQHGDPARLFRLDRHMLSHADNIRLTKAGRQLFTERGLQTEGPFGFYDIAEFTLPRVDAPSTVLKGSVFQGLTREQGESLLAFHRVHREMLENLVAEGVYPNLNAAIKGYGTTVGGKFVQVAGLGNPADIYKWIHRKALGKTIVGAKGADELLEFAPGGGRAAAGRNSDFLKSRTFELMQEGAQEGTLYAHPLESLEAFMGAGYRAIAQKRALDVLESRGKLVTSKDVLKTLYPNLIADVETADKLVNAAIGNVNRLKRMVLARKAKMPERELFAGTLRTLGERKTVQALNAELRQTQGLVQKVFHHYKVMKTHPNEGTRRLARNAMQRAVGQAKEAGINLENLWAEQKRLVTMATRGRIRVSRLESELFGKTSDLNQAVAEVALARQIQANAASAYSKQMMAIVDAADLDASVFGGTIGTRVPVAFYRDGALAGKLAPKDIGDALQARFKDRGSNILRKVEGVTGTARTLSTGVADVGWLTIQGQALALTHPTLYAKAARESLRAIFDPAARSRYMAENAGAVLSFIENGGDIGSSEFFEALSRSGLLSRVAQQIHRKLPDNIEWDEAVRTWGGRTNVVGRLGTGFNAFLDVGKVELWKSLRGVSSAGWVTDKELASHINNMLGTLNTRMLGVSPTQRQVEGGLLLFSPRYTRSAFALMGEILRSPGKLGTTQGLATREAQRAMAAFLAGGTAIMYGIGEALDKDVGLNPFKPGWLTVEVGGHRIGVGGSTRAVMDMYAKSLAAVAGLNDRDMGDLLKWNPFNPRDARENPLLSFWMSRTAPGVRDLLLRETFQGEKLDNPAEFVGKGLLPHFAPFVAQNYLQPTPGGTRTNLASVFPEMLGLRSRSLSAFENMALKRREVASKLGKQDWDQLDLEQQATARRDDDELRRFEQIAHASGTNPELAAYFDHVEADKKYRDQKLSQAAVEFHTTGNGSTFREKYDEVMSEARSFRERRDDPNGPYKEALALLAEQPESELAFNQALERFVSETREDPALYDQFGNPDFREMRSREDALEKELGEELFGRVLNYYHGFDTEGRPLTNEEYPGQRYVWLLRQAREVLREAGYWTVADAMLDGQPEAQEVWSYYQTLDNPAEQEAVKRAYPFLRRVERRAARARLAMRRRDPEVDRALTMFYGLRARSPEGRRQERELVRQARNVAAG
jgi:hypothetical protein